MRLQLQRAINDSTFNEPVDLGLLHKQVGGQWIERGFWLAVGRAPSSTETQDASALFTPDAGAEALTRFCLVLFNLNEFLYVD